MSKLTALIEQDEESGFFIAICPALKGCVSQGATEEEAIANLKKAIVGWLAVQNDRATKEAKQVAAQANHKPKELAFAFSI